MVEDVGTEAKVISPLRALAHAATWLAVGTTVAMVVVFLLAWWGVAWRAFLVDWGYFVLLVPVVVVLLTIYLRNRTGLLLMRQGRLGEVLKWCEPRSRVTLTVGRNEAAQNRLLAAGAMLRQSRPARALALLDSERRGPTSASLEGRVALVRASVLLALDDVEGARALANTLVDTPLPRSSREELERLLDALEERGA